jgi:hypothetical protein
VVLAVQPIQTEWSVIPTTIQDVYKVDLKITYQTDTKVPQLVTNPLWLGFTKNPADPSGPMLLNNSTNTSGNLTLYNPSRINVTDVVIDTSMVQGANLSLSYGDQSGPQVTIPVIPPLSNVTLGYTTLGTQCSSEDLRSSIRITGKYVYFKSVPTLSMSENDFTFPATVGLGSSHEMVLSNTGYNVATKVTVSAPTHSWVTVPRLLGDLGLTGTVPFRVVVAPPAGTPQGVYTEDLVVTSYGEDREFTFALPGSGQKVRFSYLDGNKEKRLAQMQEPNISSAMMIRILEIDGAAPTKKALADMSMRDRSALRAEMLRVDAGIDTTIECDCESCGTRLRTKLEAEPAFLFPGVRS